MNWTHSTAGHANIFHQDRRTSPRLQLSLQAVLRLEGTTVPIRVQTTDISRGGCYVEMSVTLEIGTKLEVTLWVNERKVTALAVVATKHPQFGNGIQFLHLSDQDRITLESFLDAEMHRI